MRPSQEKGKKGKTNILFAHEKPLADHTKEKGRKGKRWRIILVKKITFNWSEIRNSRERGRLSGSMIGTGEGRKAKTR